MRFQRFSALVLVAGASLLIDVSTTVQAQDAASAFDFTDSDWPWWRGPQRNGVAPSGQQPPTSWSETENVLWRTSVPGRGHGSPTLLGDQIFLASADLVRQVQVVLCLNRKTGKREWETVVHQGGFEIQGKKKPNKKASRASSTVATDGQRLFINFFHDNAIWTTALSLDGKILWQKKIADYIVHQGYGSSPVLYQDLVIVSADHKGGGAIVALQPESGDVRWRRDRPKAPNYASPIILNVAGREQLIVMGCNLVTSLDPLTGEEFWETDGATTECVTTSVTDGTRVFSTGGYPKNHIAAIVADGSGKIAWENNTRAYVPSLLQHHGFLFATLDAGVAACFRSDTGEETWKARLGGTFSSSPVIVGDLIYATNEEGTTYIFKANSEKFEKVGENQLGKSVFATPAICDSRIYTRVSQDEDGTRQEYLYCIGE